MQAALPLQPWHLGAVLTGAWRPAGWAGAMEPASWQHALAFADVAAAAAGVTVRRLADDHAPFHPGRCAKLLVPGVDGTEVLFGHAGELHPLVCRAFGLPSRTAAVEVSLDVLVEVAPGPGSIAPLSPHPVAKEDVALVVDESVSAGEVQTALAEGAGDLLESIRLFDVYRGTQVPEGAKSLAFGLRFRAADRTLKDAEIAAARDAAVAEAVRAFGAVQRA